MVEKRQVKAKKGSKASKKTAKKAQVAQAKGASRAVQVQVQINQNRKTTMGNTRKRQQALENLSAPKPPAPNPLQTVPIPFPQPQPIMTPQGVAEPNREQALFQVIKGLTNSLQSSNIQVGTSNLNLNPTTRTQLDNLPLNVGVQASPTPMTQAVQVGVPTGLQRGIEVQTDLNVASNAPMNTQLLSQFGDSRQLNASLPTGSVEQRSQATNTQRKDGRSLPVAGNTQQSLRIAPQGSVNVPDTLYERNQVGAVMENIMGQVERRERLAPATFATSSVESLIPSGLSQEQRRADLRTMIQLGNLPRNDRGEIAVNRLALQYGVADSTISRDLLALGARSPQAGRGRPRKTGK